MNIRVPGIAFGIVAFPAVVMFGIMQRLGRIGNVVAQPTHVKRDVPRQIFADLFWIA